MCKHLQNHSIQDLLLLDELPLRTLCSTIVVSDPLSNSTKTIQLVLLSPYDISFPRYCYNFTMNSLKLSGLTLDELRGYDRLEGNPSAILDYFCDRYNIMDILHSTDSPLPPNVRRNTYQALLCSNTFIHMMINVFKVVDDPLRSQFITGCLNGLKRMNSTLTGIVCVRNLLKNVCILENELGIHIDLHILENLRPIINTNCSECIHEYNEFMLVRLKSNHIPSYL
uniref:Uncharacterized protein n=1 Tax=viral metagenome TaxID=1070528 RepID=A0A6C0BMD3_9ZZZZ